MHQILNTALLDIVPSTAQTALDVGCGEGLVGAALKERQNCSVTGIEYDETKALQALRVLDTVYVGDALGIVPTLANRYDVVILGDVLEHFANPEVLLVLLKQVLTDDGCLVICFPNVQHWSVVVGLLQGCWDYRDAGILDRTHLRFFTKGSFSKLMRKAKYDIEGWSELVTRNTQIPYGFVQVLNLMGLSGDRFVKQAQVYQYVCSAYPMKELQPDESF